MMLTKKTTILLSTLIFFCLLAVPGFIADVFYKRTLQILILCILIALFFYSLYTMKRTGGKINYLSVVLPFIVGLIFFLTLIYLKKIHVL